MSPCLRASVGRALVVRRSKTRPGTSASHILSYQAFKKCLVDRGLASVGDDQKGSIPFRPGVDSASDR
jgi:hypothetical protein